MKKFLPLLILAFLLVLSSLAIYKTSAPTPDNNNDFEASFLKEKIKLPDFSLPLLYNKDQNLTKDHLINNNHKYSLVNFFASWCTTCAAEHEILLRLQNENIIDIYGIAWHDFSENTIQFLQNNKNPFKIVALDSQGLFTNILNVKAVPETILVDSQGYVIARFSGNLSEETMVQIINFLNEQK